MRPLPLLAALLLAPFAVQAQLGGSAAVLQAPPASQACPVSATARRFAGGDVLLARDGSRRSSESGLTLTLHPEAARVLTGATVTVHALSTKKRVLPSGAGPEPDISREFHLDLSASGNAYFSAGLSLDRSATILSADITELRYADGAAWRAHGGARCHVEPDGLVQIAGKQ